MMSIQENSSNVVTTLSLAGVFVVGAFEPFCFLKIKNLQQY